MAVLPPKIKKRQQEEPQPVHEVPVVGRQFGGNGARNVRSFKSPQSHEKKRRHASEKMQPVQPRKNIEEAALLGCGHIKASGTHLPPSNELTSQKQHSQGGRHGPYLPKLGHIYKRQLLPR